MTEREPIHLPLTAKPQNTYSRGGDIFMEGGGQSEIPKGVLPAEKSPHAVAEGKTGASAEESRKEWYGVFTDKELRNPDTRSTIEAAIALGIAPQQVTSKGNIEQTAKEVVANAFLSDPQRLVKAQEALGQLLTDEQKAAILKSHYIGGDEKGKNTGKAGVYNYTQDQLRRKAEILRSAGFSKEQTRLIIEAGIASEPITETYADLDLQDIVQEYNRAVERATARGTNVDPHTLIDLRAQVRDAKNSGRADRAQANDLIDKLNTIFEEENPQERGREDREERIGLYLQQDDREQLRENPIAWLDGQFDQLYLIARQGRELDSPLVDQIRRLISDALQYVSKKRPEMVNSFSALDTTRFNLMSMRTTIGYSSIENIKKASFTLGAHGLFSGLALENGEVSSMFNRLHEVFEDERLKSKLQHATPAMVHELQEKVIQEQVDLAKKGQGNFGSLEDIATRIDAVLAKKIANEELHPNERIELTDEEKIIADRAIEVRSKITRSVRTAYDIFVSSQRQAVLVARGKHLTGNDAYFSDPFTGPLNVYNLEDLLIQKFGIYNAEDEEFVRRIKLDLADSNLRGKGKDPSKLSEMEREDLGRRLFRDLFAVPDFFSSGWRIEGVLSSIEERIGKEKAENFALFMRLKLVNPIKEPKKRGEIWEKIAKYRPEEIIRLFRERADGELNSLFEDTAFTNANIHNYDELKEKYGSVLRLLREEGFRKADPKQIDIAELSDNDQIEKIDKILGDGEGRKLIAMFGRMQSFIKDKSLIKTLLEDNRFEDIYTRTLLVDDALLDKLENEENGFVPLSQKYASNQGQDSLVRIWNDTENAVAAGQHLIKFIKTEDGEERMKSALEFADSVSQYNGQGARANCVRYTIGTFLDLSKQGYFWDVIGLDKLPFRRAMSEIEKIYGPQAKPISRDELRQNLDKIRLFLNDNIKEETEEEKEKIQKIKDKKGDIEAWKATKALREEKKENARKAYRDLESILEVTMGDTAKRKALSFLFLFLLSVLGAAYQTGKHAMPMSKAA